MGTIKKVGEKSYNQDANGDWHEVESPVQKEPENAKVLNGVTYYKDDAGNWYEGGKVSQKKNDGQPSKTGGQEQNQSGKAPSPSPSPSPFQDDKSKTREQIAREDFESSMPFLTEKIKINQPGDIMTGQQRNQMAASKVKSDKIENYRTQVLPQKVKEEKEKAKQASLKPELGEQFNPVDFATNDIATYSGGASLNLDPKAPSADKFHQLNQFFGNDASNVAPYFDNRVKAVDKQIAQIKQNPMLWRSLNQGKSDIAEIEKLKDYKLKLAAASNKLATDYTAWLYPDESLERKGEIQRKLSGDGSVNQEIAFKEKGIPLTDEQKFNNAKIGIDVERTRLENDYRDVPSDQRDDAYFQRLAQVDNMDETLLNQFPDYKKNQVGMMVAQLASQDPNIDASSLIGFIPQDLDQKTINYISEKYKIPKEDLQGLQYGDIPDESILSNVRKSALGLTAGFVTGATRILGSALGVDSDRLTYVNNKISGLPDYIAGNNPYQKTTHPQSIVDINPTSATYLQNIPNPKAGKSNYNLTTVSHSIATGAAEFAAFMTGLELTTAAVKGGAKLAGMALTAEAAQSAAMTTYMVVHNYENNWQRGNEVMGEDASEIGKAMYATLSGYIDKLAFDVLPKDKLFLSNQAKAAMDKELSPLLKDLTIKNINKEVLQTKVQKVVQGLINTSKEVGHITAAMDAAAISKAVVNSVVGKDEPKKYFEEAWHEIKQNTVEIPLTMGLPLGVMEVVKAKQHSSFFKENVYSAGLEPNKYIALIRQELGKGNLTPEEANSRMEVVKTMHNIVQSTPDINPLTNKPFTHNQQVEYAYNRLKESGLRAKALEHTEDPAIASIYLRDAQDLADVRKAMLKSFSNPPKQAEAPKEKTIPQQKVDIERQRQDELEKNPEDADNINAKYDAEIEKLSNQEKPIESVMSKEDLDKTQSIIDRIGNNESINEGEMKEAEDILYDTLDKNPDSAHLIEPLILKLQNHENLTKTETIQTTERKPVEGTFAAKRKVEIKPALEQSEGSTARVTLADGTTAEGTLRIQDGNYVLEVEGQEPIVIGETAITNRDLKVPEGESPIELDEDGNVKPATFETKDGHRVTITDPEKALDLGIQLSLETVGEIPDEAFDKVYEDVIKEDKIEVPIEKPKVVEEVKTEAETPKEGEPEQKSEADRQKEIERLRAEEQAEYDAMPDPTDEAKRKEIYDKYDKLISPLLKEGEPKAEVPKQKKKQPKGKAAKFVAENLAEPDSEGEGEPKPVEEGESEGAVPTQTHTVETIDQVDTTGFNKVQKKNISDIKRVLQAITQLVGKDIGKNLKVIIHSTRESAAQAAYDSTIKGGGTEAEARDNMQNQGNKGWWASSDGEIHLNIPEVSSETALHEGVHPILDAIAKIKPEVIDQFHKQLEALPEGKEITKIAEDNYAEYDGQGNITNPQTVKNEAITDYIAKVADGQIKIDRSNFEKVKDYVVNLLTKLGVMPEKDIRSIDDLRKLAQTVSEKFAKGEELKFKDVSEIKSNQKFQPIKNNGESGDVNAAGKIESKNISDAKVGNTNPLFSKETFKEVELVNLPVKSLKEKLDEFDNKAIAINSDPTKVGKVEMPSGKEIFLYGGARYSSIKSNVEGEIGFSSTNLSKPKQVRGAIEKLFPEKNGEGLVLVTTQKPESMKGNAYSLEYTLDALSTLPKTILKSSEFKNEFFGKDIVAIKDAFGENKYNEFLKKYGRADFSNPEVFKAMIDDLLSNVGANFIARNSLMDNMLAGIVAKDTRISTKGEPGYISVDPKKYIAKQLLDRLGLNQEKLFYELGEKGIVDAYMNEGKWGFVTNGFTSDSKIDHLSIQDKGVIHPQFNSKFHGKDAFFLDGAYMIDKLFLPEEMITKKGDIYIKKASLMVAGSMYPKGKVELAPKELEKPFSEIPEQKTPQFSKVKDVEYTAKALEDVSKGNANAIKNIGGEEYYHGTSLPKNESDFTSPNRDKGEGVRSNSFMGTTRKQKSPFFFITSEKSVANDFAKSKQDYFNDGLKSKENHTARVIPFKFDEKNSKVLDLTKDDYENKMEEIGFNPIDDYGIGMYDESMMWEYLDDPKFAEKLKSLGYDAVKFVEPKRGIGIAVLNTEKVIHSSPKGIAEAYHKGNNPNLIKSVNEALGKAELPKQEGVGEVEAKVLTMDNFDTFRDAVKYNVKRTADIALDESKADYGDNKNIDELKEDLNDAGIVIEKVDSSEMMDGNYASYDGDKIKVTDENIPLQVLLHEIGEKVISDLDKSKTKIEHSNNIFEAVTTYGASRGNDAFADNFYLYFLSPETLKDLSPNVYNELNRLIPNNIKKLGKKLMDTYGTSEQILKYNKPKLTGEILSKEQSSLNKERAKTTENKGEKAINEQKELIKERQAELPQQKGVGEIKTEPPMFSKSKDKKMSDMKDILKEYVDEGKSLDEIKDILKDEFGDYYKDVEKIIEQAHQEMTTTGIKNAVTEKERAERGLAEVEVEAKRSFGKVFDDAKQMIANGVANGLTLAAEIIKNPRPLKAEESAVLLIDRMRISNEYNKKNAELLEAQKNGEKDKADIIQSQMEALEEEMDLNDEAARKSGYEQGLGLAARRMLIAQDYSLVTQMNRLKAANGGAEVPKQYQEQLKTLITQLEEANNKLDKLEKTQAGTEKQKEVSKVKPVSRTPEQVEKEKQNIKSKIVAKWGQTLARMKAATSIKRAVSPTPVTPQKQAQLESIVKDVNDMVKLYAESGVTDLKKIIDNVHQDLVGSMPGLDRVDVEDIVLGKYDTQKPKTPLTPAKIQAQANVRKVKTQIDMLKEELKNKQRGGVEKAVDYLHGWHRFSILSGVPSAAKIGTAALTRGIVTRGENIVGQALSLIPGIRKIAKQAPREGGFSRSAESKAFSSWFDKMTRDDMAEVMKTGISQIDYLYGAKEPKAPKVPEWMEFFGRMHSAIKLLPKRAEFFRSLEMRTEQALKEGKNINDAVVQQELGVAAYNDALRSIFMQDNILTENYQAAIRKYEETQPTTASLLKFLFPIVKVPSNYVAEQSSYIPVVAAVKAITALYKGRKGMPPEQADFFMRALKKGSIGTAFIALGFFNPVNFGGYYTGKRKKDDLEAGDIELFGVKLPHFMLHTPLLEMLQVGSTMRRAAESQLAKGEEPSKTLGMYTGGIPAVLKGQLTQIPFIGTGERTMKLLENKTADGIKEFGNSMAQSVVEPQLMQNLADFIDREEGKTVKRESKGLVEKLKEGTPGLRQTLKQDKSKFTDKEYEEFSNITEKGLNIPELNKRTTYKVKIDTEHPDGHMTEEEYDKFIPLQKEYVKDAYKKFYGSHKSDFDKLQKMIDAVPETSEEKAKMNALKDAIQNKIDAVHNEAIKAAKRKIGLHQK